MLELEPYAKFECSIKNKITLILQLIQLNLMNVFMKLYFACLKLIKIIEFLLKYRFICVIKQLTLSKSKFVFVLNSKSTISMILALQKFHVTG